MASTFYSLNSMDTNETPRLRGNNTLSRIWFFYLDGFRSMTLGRTLWAIILIKVVVFFVIVKLLFFPNFLNSKATDDEGKAEYVRHELVDDP